MLGKWGDVVLKKVYDDEKCWEMFKFPWKLGEKWMCLGN